MAIPPVMRWSDKTLIHKLTLVLLLKLLLLSLLWWAFVRDARQTVDERQQAEHLLSPVTPSSEGAPHDL